MESSGIIKYYIIGLAATVLLFLVIMTIMNIIRKSKNSGWEGQHSEFSVIYHPGVNIHSIDGKAINNNDSVLYHSINGKAINNNDSVLYHSYEEYFKIAHGTYLFEVEGVESTTITKLLNRGTNTHVVNYGKSKVEVTIQPNRKYELSYSVEEAKFNLKEIG